MRAWTRAPIRGMVWTAMPAKVIPFHDKRNPRKRMFLSLPAVKSGPGKRKGLSYALCIDLSVVPGFDSRPPKVMPLPAQESGVENGLKTLKTKRKRR